MYPNIMREYLCLFLYPIAGDLSVWMVLAGGLYLSIYDRFVADINGDRPSIVYLPFASVVDKQLIPVDDAYMKVIAWSQCKGLHPSWVFTRGHS